MSIIDDFELGAAGLADGAEHLVGIRSTHAANLYAEQTAKAKGLDAPAAEALRVQADEIELNTPILSNAAGKTADQLAAGAKKLSLGLLSAAEWGLGLAVGVGLLFVSWKAWRTLS